MDYEFNNDYMARLLVDLVRDEGNRILSLGLAKRDDLKALVDTSLSMAIKRVGIKSPNLLIETLGALHDKLSGVKLPGDFEPAKDDIEHKLIILFDIKPTHTVSPVGMVPDVVIVDDGSDKKAIEEDEKVVEKDKEDEPDDEEDDFEDAHMLPS